MSLDLRCGLILLLVTLTWGVVAQEPAPARLKVSGYGILGNRNLKKALRLLEETGKRSEFFDASFIEDAALVLISRLNRDGFLKPKISARLTLAGGSAVAYEWQKAVRDQPLPRPLRARLVEFEVDKGVLFHFGTIQWRGLRAIAEKNANAYFIETGALFPLKQTKIYSPDRLRRGLASLTEALNRLGYESAQAAATEIDQDDTNGRVNLVIEVAEGLKSSVRSIRTEYFYHDAAEPSETAVIRTNVPFSKLWVQDLMQQLRATNYHKGYPDTTVEISQPRRETSGDRIQVDLLAQVRSGPQVRLGQVHFAGQEKTKESLLEGRVKLEEGKLLDRIQAEQGRYRLARLGVFDSVLLKYEPVDEHTRDVTYQVKEGKTIDFSLLFGYGSYELLRLGVELQQNNIFGRAHHARLRLIQSLKASYGEYIYTLPEFAGRHMDLFINGSALRRDEIDFTREEFGGGLGARKYIRLIESDVIFRYNYQVLNSSAAELAFDRGLPSANVGAFITEIRHDRRDSPLYPRQGYRLFGTFEVASEYFAGEVNYQRLQLDASYHQPLDPGRWLHLGLSHGAVLALGGAATDLPFNRRFFPGGDTSIRGYQQGEAAPRNARGKIVGAESFLFGSIELEQSLTSAWSLVGFLDTVSFAERLSEYPFNETLFSAGGGIRWKTIIGPVRLEYGYNLNRRRHDPAGTLQFSLGFPF